MLLRSLRQRESFLTGASSANKTRAISYSKGGVMSTETSSGWQSIGAEEIRRSWGWFLALGIVLVILGVAALSWSVLTTLVSVVMIGWLLLIGGVLSVIHAFMRRRWGGYFIELFAGLKIGSS
jgi:uncharacterized membrane protein HdeD (DUF308 family)